ncbi:Protein CBG23668 [Caenorhabditis briggsae]|uniref:sphingomyelin phosphodiesterase n=2 Tax=Caenorhabditis briggsae TaxID=6238 RepID=A0AAE9E991_CAEBR|nr:Protein CBG23668 [Caenorhabditis briggsae]UMM14958.1 hypothetical protein L5515_002576 [Caenorhabditis briggsae]CAP20464.2 Protein CBG23668 [Caenorhabditis briggsae]
MTSSSNTTESESLESGKDVVEEPVIRRESFAALRRNNVAPRQLRIVTLNAWCLPQPWPIGSTDRVHRLQKIGEYMRNETYDIVGLQELWSYNDFVRLSEQVKDAYPYFHYFHSGFTGSGVCVFSRHPIVSTLTSRYSLNGFAHHIHRGDWFGGKVVGLTEVEIDGDLRVNFYTTHLHAEYDRENDLYLPHRTAQSFELAQFVRHTARGADVVIVTGDLNMEPCDLGFRLILSHAKLFDAWRMSHEVETTDGDDGELLKFRGIAKGGTCDRPDNCYSKKALREKDDSKRIDYMLFKSGRCNVKLEECEITLNQIPGEDLNYSDHVGLRARFTIDDRFRHEKSINTWEPNRPLLIEAIGIVAGGERRARTDRIFFLVLAGICLILILGSLFFEVFPMGFAILRFALTVIGVFFVWQGLIGLTLERKALKAAKQAMQQILNN